MELQEEQRPLTSEPEEHETIIVFAEDPTECEDYMNAGAAAAAINRYRAEKGLAELRIASQPTARDCTRQPWFV